MDITIWHVVFNLHFPSILSVLFTQKTAPSFNESLVAGWTNPSEKYAHQIGSFPQKPGWFFSKYVSCYPPRSPCHPPRSRAQNSLCSSMGSRLPTGCGTLLGPRPGPCKGTSKVPSFQALRSEDLRSSRLKPNVTCQVIQGDLFGMVKWPFQMVKWPPTRGWKGHIESPGADQPKIPPGFFHGEKSQGIFRKT